MKRNITQERLKSLLHYDPLSGQFTRLVDGKHTKAGERAGYVKGSGYREIYISGDLYYEHRLAFLYMTGSFPEHQADHINHIKDDNRWCNLRPATSTENNRNTGLRKDNKSGVTGVSWCNGKQKWMASCHADGKTKYLGYFENIQEAAVVATSARQKYHGAFATNSSQTITTEQVN
jgi:hypothetical protein